MKNFHDYHLPGVGLRIVKSALVVFLCLSLSLFRYVHGAPLYVAIAAILCIQPTMESSKEAGIGRLFGTLLGGFWGSIVLLINLYLLQGYHMLIQYALISATIIPVIYSAVALKRHSAVFLSCVVFLSITVSNAGEIGPLVFVFNRMLDTFIGVIIAMVVNCFYLPQKKDIK